MPVRRGFVTITRRVDEFMKKSGVKEGICLLNAMRIMKNDKTQAGGVKLSSFGV